ncbi:MAG: formylglycine-generating enzyme family protein [Pirellulaceae bacterium]
MKTSLVWRFLTAMAVLSGGCGMAGMSDQMVDTSPERQASPVAPTTPQQPAALNQQAAAARKLGLPVVETNSIGMKLVLIPAGEFLMGSPATEKGRKGDEQQHLVRVTKSFQLGVYEVTQEAYERVMGVNPSLFKGPQQPVENVNWIDAIEFCNKLSELREEKAAGRIYRLPTEAQWEYACGAGTTTCYSFGDDADAMGDHGWFSDNSALTTHPVGEKLPNAWGLYDMHGNVWEWCWDWYDGGYYMNSPVDDPTGPAAGSLRVFRGGGWFYPAMICRMARRHGIQPDYGSKGILGFRVVAVPSAIRQVEPVTPKADVDRAQD